MKKIHIKRRPGSCRFSDYYKLEWRDEAMSIWRPLQKSFPTKAEAIAAMKGGRQWRIMEVTETGRRFLA
jgi:hypothetical protein